jgi:hypothetical protein
MSIAGELAKLAKPKEQGVVSESEFQQMKQDLISRGRMNINNSNRRRNYYT